MDKTRVYQSIVSLMVPPGPAPAVDLEAFCNDANDVLLSGGFYRAHLGLEIYSSYPLLVPFGNAGWHVSVTSNGAAGLAQAVAVCYRVD